MWRKYRWYIFIGLLLLLVLVLVIANQQYNAGLEAFS